MKAKEVKLKLGCSAVSVKNGVFTARKGFYYRMGKDAIDFRNRVMEVFPNADIMDYGEVYKPFRGGASVADQSHWYVKFNLD
jgi:hypothetical protein